MRVKKITIKNFKRFTDLTIDHIPETAKLVLLIGANGSGKSSVFDAFDWLSKGAWKGLPINPDDYYNKDKSQEPTIDLLFSDSKEIHKSGPIIKAQDQQLAKRFLGRSSIRIVPRITNNANPDVVSDDRDSPNTYIENDMRFVNDVFIYIQQINNALRGPVFRGEQADTLKIFRDFIEPLNKSLLNIFGGDEATTIQIAAYEDATPNTAAKLIFQKGKSRINYELLSHGEKQVVILLINFIVRQEYYKDAIVFIDEMDCHLNTSLQYSLINEIVDRWIPNESQLWTASHALGFIEYANQSDQAAIYDFDSFDFDFPRVLLPEPKNNLDIYEIAVPKTLLAEILKGKRIVVCENQNDLYYNMLGLADTVFVGVKDSKDVFWAVKRDAGTVSIRDRDFLSDAEIEKIRNRYPNHHILDYYCFENYMYHPDNIAELNIDGFDKGLYASEIQRQKNEKMLYILPNLGTSRQNYEEFKTDNIKDKEINSIVDDFKSKEFERFYKFFDMKSQFDKSLLTRYNLSKEQLVKTNWFKGKISEILI